ncbi:hypothetical protein ACT3SP_03345 [Brachybacterium sp. AOP43-C2-M15]|uniref:hypothetical protein n=1 Tax=Brachybacterium sp. AOP43-C2-M15 TaxID=3457661 RepID=UPI0040338F9E
MAGEQDDERTGTTDSTPRGALAAETTAPFDLLDPPPRTLGSPSRTLELLRRLGL